MEMTSYTLDKMAAKAANGFQDSHDLNKEIAKIAEDNELTPPQIQSLVEEANHEVYRRMYKSAEDKNFSFDVAKADEVLSLLNAEPEAPKVASVSSIGFNNLRIDRNRTKTAAFGSTVEEVPDWVKDPDARLRTVKIMMKDAAEKLTQYADELRSKANVHKLAAGGAHDEMLSLIKQYVRNGVKLGTIAKAACIREPKLSRSIGHVFSNIKLEYEKTATAVEKELLEFDPKELDGKDEIGTRIVNGNNPIFVHLDDLFDHSANLAGCQPAEKKLRDVASAIVASVHRLETPEDVDKYLVNEVQRFSNRVKMGAVEALEAAAVLDLSNPKADSAQVTDEWRKLARGMGALWGSRAKRLGSVLKTPFSGAYNLARRGTKATVGAGKAMKGVAQTAGAARDIGRAGSEAVRGALGKGPKKPGEPGLFSKAVFSPLGFGSGKAGEPMGLASLAGLLYSGSEAAKGVGESAKAMTRPFYAGGARDLGVSLME